MLRLQLYAGKQVLPKTRTERKNEAQTGYDKVVDLYIL